MLAFQAAMVDTYLISGSTVDLPERWSPLSHAITVNKMLGYGRRVAMTSRDGHHFNS